MADGVFVIEAAVVLGTLLRRDFRDAWLLSRRDDVQVNVGLQLSGGLVKREDEFPVFPERTFPVAEASVS